MRLPLLTLLLCCVPLALGCSEKKGKKVPGVLQGMGEEKPQSREEMIARLKVQKAELHNFFTQFKGADPIMGLWRAETESLQNSMLNKFYKNESQAKKMPKEMLLQRIKETHIYLRFLEDDKLLFRTFAFNGLTYTVEGSYKYYKPKQGGRWYKAYLVQGKRKDGKINAQLVDLVLQKNKLTYKDENGTLDLVLEERTPEQLADFYHKRQEAFVPVIEY